MYITQLLIKENPFSYITMQNFAIFDVGKKKKEIYIKVLKRRVKWSKVMAYIRSSLFINNLPMDGIMIHFCGWCYIQNPKSCCKEKKTWWLEMLDLGFPHLFNTAQSFMYYTLYILYIFYRKVIWSFPIRYFSKLDFWVFPLFRLKDWKNVMVNNLKGTGIKPNHVTLAAHIEQEPKINFDNQLSIKRVYWGGKKEKKNKIKERENKIK